jgi:hypothetical protein
MQAQISTEDSTTALSFATLTVITDHGKRHGALNRTALILPENKTTAAHAAA